MKEKISDFDAHFGLCPKCLKRGICRNIRENHWFGCDDCKIKWHVGSNLFTHWKKENEEIWLENAGLLQEYTDADRLDDGEPVVRFFIGPYVRDLKISVGNNPGGAAVLKALADLGLTPMPKCFGLADRNSGNTVQGFHCNAYRERGECSQEIAANCWGRFDATIHRTAEDPF